MPPPSSIHPCWLVVEVSFNIESALESIPRDALPGSTSPPLSLSAFPSAAERGGRNLATTSSVGRAAAGTAAGQPVIRRREEELRREYQQRCNRERT